MLTFQSGQLRPWRWTGNVSAKSKGKPPTIDLSSPSIFRIVLNSLLPYHGHIVPNAINNAFFAEFNGGRCPAHVTIMPLLVDGQLSGMVLGMTDAEINYKLSLHMMESFAADASKALQRIQGAGRAA